MNDGPKPVPPTLAASVEVRATPTGIMLAAPAGSGYCQIDRPLEEVNAILAGSASPEGLVERFGSDALELVTDLRAEGYLTDSPPATRDRWLVVTPDGIELAGADRLVAAVYRLLRPAYNRVGGVLLAILAVVGIATPLWLLPRVDAHAAASPVFAAAVLLAIGIPITVVHELGHAVVLARHGRRIGRVGVGLYWGALSFYVDSTAAFFLPRADRIRQAAAGPVAEAATAGAAALLALTLPPGAAQVVAVQAAGLAALGAVLNLVPLLKLDGYWLISDALDIPDLHEQCLAAARRVASGSRTRGDVLRAGYVVTGLILGVALLGYAVLMWMELIGDVIVAAWVAGLVGKLLAAALTLPLALLVAHLLWATASRIVTGRRSGASRQPAVHN